MDNKWDTVDSKRLGDPFRWADQFMARYTDGSDITESLPDRWHYENGCFLKAIEGCYRATGDERYFAYIRDTMERFVAEDGSIAGYRLEDYNLDQINQGKLLFLLAERTGDQRYRAAIERLVDQLRSHPRTDEGGFWHKKIYPFQMWLDGLYMAAPFMAQYAAWSGEQAWFDEAAFQLELIEAKARLPRSRG